MFEGEIVLTMFDARYCYYELNQMGAESFFVCDPSNSQARHRPAFEVHDLYHAQREDEV
jgi:hypothetical protein